MANGATHRHLAVLENPPYVSRRVRSWPQQEHSFGKSAVAPGKLIQVRSMPSITQSLNDRAYNRGLWFSPEMRLLCGTQQRVERRIDKLIVDGTGEMRQLRNTVYLENSLCG